MATSRRKDELGDRMKRYEVTTQLTLPRRTYTILRVDGRAFHSWTRGLAKPYDKQLMDCMDAAAVALCGSIAGSQFAFVQSDEISILATDFADTETQPWFDGNVQKWVSVSASIATMSFNERVSYYNSARDTSILGSNKRPTAVFDARVFIVPDLIEVENYFVWRQQDAERNSVMMLARAYASHKALAGKNRAAQHEIIHEAGDNWAKHPARFKHGGVIRRSDVKEWGKDIGPQPDADSYRVGNWFVDSKTPVFTRNGGRAYLRNLVPVIWNDDLLIRKAAANG